MSVADSNNLYADEKNVFRKQRSCADHIFSLTSVIRNRKNNKLTTHVAFVDLVKAFDTVEQN